MTDMARIERARELEAEARQLRKEANRKLPDFWRVGQKVRYIRSSEWAFDKGDIAIVTEIREECRNRPANEYQVFFTRPLCISDGRFWTTPDDVELIEDCK